MIRQLIGKFDSEALNVKPVYGPNRAGDIPHSLASIEKAQRLLGYKPAQTVREGMAEAISWYRDNL
jgi:UDP-N-acetylglucosamine 4-epimerase